MITFLEYRIIDITVNDLFFNHSKGVQIASCLMMSKSSFWDEIEHFIWQIC